MIALILFVFAMKALFLLILILTIRNEHRLASYGCTAPSFRPSPYHSSSCSNSQPSLIPILQPLILTYQSTTEPSLIPSTKPTYASQVISTYQPSVILPSLTPSENPVLSTYAPSLPPSHKPSMLPATLAPTTFPTYIPSVVPSCSPSTTFPTYSPSVVPSSGPSTTFPTHSPSVVPSSSPSNVPTFSPSVAPSTIQPSFSPTLETQFPVVQLISNINTAQCDTVNSASVNRLNLVIISTVVAALTGVVDNDITPRQLSIQITNTGAALLETVYTIFFTFGTLSRCDRYQQLGTELRTSIANGTFTRLLRVNALQSNQPCLSTAEAILQPFIQPISNCNPV